MSHAPIADTANTADTAEVAKFDAMATAWWDPQGPLRTLHAINPLRIDYIAARMNLKGAHIADVGCGAGLLAEGLARAGAHVTAVDLAPGSIGAARAHALQSGLDIRYEIADAAALAVRKGAAFDAVTCFEVLEHVPNPGATIAACAALLKPGGHAFFSTLNRNPKSFLLAIVGAEYVLGMLPRGTHQYARLLRPSELARACRAARLRILDLTGLHFDPLAQAYLLGGNVDVNYFCHARLESPF
jgi:2-polyprenyl-6-hydroxyphenyl methylase/3-demethylubiquinone-9 3-methyltransferase